MEKYRGDDVYKLVKEDEWWRVVWEGKEKRR